MGFLKDSKYPLDLSRLSDGFRASLLPYLSKDPFVAFDVVEEPDGLHIHVGDVSRSIPLANLPLLEELFIPQEFYNLVVSSDYAEDITSVTGTFETVDEFAKFFTVVGSLIALQNGLAASCLYDNRALSSKNPKIAELLTATLRFWDQVERVYAKMAEVTGFVTPEYLKSERLFPSIRVAESYFEDITRISTQHEGQLDMRNRLPASLLLAYHSLYLGLIGSTLTIANIGGQEFQKLLSMKDPDQVAALLGTLANSQGTILPNNPDASLNDQKKKYFALLVNFHVFHKFVTAHTGYEFQDPFAEAFCLWGGKLNESLGSDNDKYYIDQALIGLGENEVNSFFQATNLFHPILEWNAMSHTHLENDSVTPYAMVSAFTLSLWKNEGTEKYFQNPLLKAFPTDEDLTDEAEQLGETFKIVAAEMASTSDTVDPYRIYRLALLATGIRTKYLGSDVGKNLLAFVENYMSALYLSWFRAGKFFKSSRNMNGFGGVEAYDSLHKEVLMIIGTYQQFIYSSITNKPNDPEQVYYYGTMMETLMYSWIYLTKEEKPYYQSFSNTLKNLVLALDKPSDVARSLYQGETIGAVAEIIGAFNVEVQLRSIVNAYDREVAVPAKKKDIDAIMAIPFQEDSYAQELAALIPGTELEMRCLVLGGSRIPAIQPLDHATFFVVSAIEKILALWSEKNALFVDSKQILPEGEAKYLIVRSSFMEGGTLNTLEKEVDEINPLLGS